MIGLFIDALIFLVLVGGLQAHGDPVPQHPDEDHEICFYYRRGDYTRTEAEGYLKDAHSRMSLDTFCKIRPSEWAAIEEMQECHTDAGCPDYDVKKLKRLEKISPKAAVQFLKNARRQK